MKENQQDNQWLDEICEQLQDFEAPIPADGWERVSSSLPPIEKPMIGKRWMGVAASALLCAMIGGGYYCYNDEPVEVKELAENEDIQQVQEVLTADIAQEEKQNTPQAQILPRKQIERNSVAVPSISHVEEEKQKEEKTIVKTQEKEDETPVSTDTIIPVLSREEEKVLLAMNEASSKRQEDAGWSLGLHFGGHGSLMDGELAKGPESMSDPNYGYGQGVGGSIGEDEIINSNRHASWGFGLSIGHQVLPKTTLETGLVYSMLTSDVKMKHAGIKEQKIQYLGVPLKLNYQIVGNQQCQLYASGGVMLERTLSAKRGDEKLDIKPWQWSSNLSIGGQLRISNHLSLYLEPGVSWYFDADPSAPTLHSESPVYFNLRGGIRIHSFFTK